MTQAASTEGATCIVVRYVDELLPYAASLEDLAAHAVEPNVYYEPWMLIPAAKWLRHEGELRFVLTLSQAGERQVQTPGVIGLFPVETSCRYDRFPIRTLRLWKHDKCFLCVPLLRAGWEREALRAFLDWMRSSPMGGAVLDWNQITSGGPFHRALVSVLAERRQASLVDEVSVRSVLSRAASCEAFLEQAVSRRHQRDIERKERKLAKLGRLEYVLLEQERELGEWIERFLEIESSGWKGAAGTSLAQVSGDAEFFREAITGAQRRGRLTMLGLRLDGRLIAIKCNLRSGAVSFAFMIAFDERYAAHSPGLLLEMENIRQLHSDPEVSRMDSCADPGNLMFERIWNDTMIIQRLIASNGAALSDLRVASIPLMRCLARAVRAIWKRPFASRSGHAAHGMNTTSDMRALHLDDDTTRKSRAADRDCPVRCA